MPVEVEVIKYVEKPVVHIQEVEKVVYKDRIIKQEVLKEVPVEKIIIKEAEKIIEKPVVIEKVIEVPQKDGQRAIQVT